MPGASAYPVVKQAIVTRLKARPALSGVMVLDRPPVTRDELRSAGTSQVIYGVDAETVYVDRVFCAGNLRFDEELTLTFGIEALGYDSDDTQTVVDDRVNEMIYEFLADLSAQKDWDRSALGLDVFDYCYFTPSGGTWTGGYLQDTKVFSAGFELRLGVNFRRSFT